MVFAALFVVQLVVYHDAFRIGPSGDDLNAPLADIWRGEAQGPLALLIQSAQPHNYRPLQSLTMWAFGEISLEHRGFWIHLPHFVGMILFALAGWLWLTSMPVSTRAGAFGATLLFVHPVLVAPLAGVDGFSTLFSTGLMWISVYYVFAWRDRPAMALMTALPIFALALGFKEYALGAVPLACMVALCFSGSAKVAVIRACVIGVALSVMVLAFIAIRKVTIPQPTQGQDVGYLLIDPVTWIKNAAMFVGVLLFPGSTKWMFVDRSIAVLGVSAAAMLLCGATLLIGLVWRWMAARSTGDSRPSESDSPRSWIVFGLFGLAGASFPAVLVVHVSEMYVAGMLVPLAMLIALSTDGFRSRSRGVRMVGGLVLAGAVVWCVCSVRAKTMDLRRMGDRTASMLLDIMKLLPDDAHDITIAACFPPDPEGARYYSVFEAPPRLLIEQPQSLWWLRPHRNLSIAFPQPTLEEALANPDAYDVIARWNPDTQRMQLVQSHLPSSASYTTTEQ